MTEVHRIIPEQYVRSFLEEGLYFSPCSTFVDLLEFRLGYCYFTKSGPTNALTKCVRDTFADAGVNDLIDGTCISCWTHDQTERHSLWEIYSRGTASIRISFDEEALRNHVATLKLPGMSGPVTYGFQTSFIRPQFLTTLDGSIPDWEDTRHMFFHKDYFYSYEKEFRVIIAANKGFSVPFDSKLVTKIRLSPVACLNKDLLSALEDRFAGRVKPSSLTEKCR